MTKEYCRLYLASSAHSNTLKHMKT